MSTDFNKYFKHYIDQVNGLEPLPALKETSIELADLLSKIDEEKGGYRYEEGKWSIKEVIGHILDVERVFAYRAMRFARNDDNTLTGFDDKLYAENSNADNRSVVEMSHEFDLLRKSTIAMFESFNNEMWGRGGSANNIDFSVSQLALLIAGHGRHHGHILLERYSI